jgi:hypothetical protein
MLIWILQTIIISFIFIFLIHHLFQFFRDTLTVPKIKDLVNRPSKKYEHIYEIISKKSETQNVTNTTDIHLLPTTNEDTSFLNVNINKNENHSMKDELKDFLKSQMKTEQEPTYYEFK